MITFDKQILFVHVPKTAGQSITKFLIENCGNEYNLDDPSFMLIKNNKRMLPGPENYHHLFLSEYTDLGLIGEQEIHKYFCFCIVRNPYDRFISAFRFNKLHKKYPSYHDFLKTLPQLQDKNSDIYRHFCPQYYYVQQKKQRINVSTYKLEDNLKRTVENNFYNRFGFNKPLETINKTSKKNKSSSLTKIEIDLINLFYEKDFKLFNYDFL